MKRQTELSDNVSVLPRADVLLAMPYNGKKGPEIMKLPAKITYSHPQQNLVSSHVARVKTTHCRTL